MEGEFESSKNVVSNGCETNMKKFNFNFKFLDRFKKSKHSEDTEQTDPNIEMDEVDNESEDNFANFQEMPRSTSEKTQPGIATPTFDEDAFSDENPEEFAEKTLSNYNLNQFREQNQQLINDNLDEVDRTDSNINFDSQLDLPGQSESVSRFKFKFPKFSRSEAQKNIRARFSDASPMKTIDKFSWNDFILKIFS